MNIEEDIIAKRPHLSALLRFYERSVLFTDAVMALAIPSDPRLNAYPPKFIGRIVERFLFVFDMPKGGLTPLKQALELGEIDFKRLPLLEAPAFSLPYPEDDLMTLLFLISRPFFLGMRNDLPSSARPREEGRCSVCNARPTLSFVTPEGRRQQYCSFCGMNELDDALGCPVCHNKDSRRLHTFVFEHEEGFSLLACDSCTSYVKTVNGFLPAGMTPDLADLMSLPLDIAVQEKGYKRLSPNPIGMVRMSGSG